MVDTCGECLRITRLLEKSNEWRRKSDNKVFELAEKLRCRSEKEVTLDSEIAMNAVLTSEIESLTAQLEDSQYCLEHMTNSYNAGVFEAADLRAKLEEATKALEKIAETETQSWTQREGKAYNWEVAKQALSTIRGK